MSQGQGNAFRVLLFRMLNMMLKAYLNESLTGGGVTEGLHTGPWGGDSRDCGVTAALLAATGLPLRVAVRG
jgi:hypothetical protein